MAPLEVSSGSPLIRDRSARVCEARLLELNIVNL